MDIRSLISKLESIESMTKISEAGDPAAYELAQQKMANLEKAAKYTGDDPIVRSRMGLPPKLPPIDQWDGKQPEPVGKPDWFSRLTTMGGSTDAQATAVKQNTALDTSAKFKTDKLKQLNDLVAKLNAEAKQGGAAPAAAPAAAPSNLGELLLREFGLDEEGSAGGDPSTLTVYGKTGAQTDALTAAARAKAGAPAGSSAQPAPAAAPAAAPAGGDTVSQLQAVMKELSDLGDDPEVAKALQSAQAAIDAAQKAKQTAGAGKTAVDPAKLKRFQELLAKLGKTGGAAAPKATNAATLQQAKTAASGGSAT